METHASHSVLMKALATLGQRPPEELARLAGGPAHGHLQESVLAPVRGIDRAH